MSMFLFIYVVNRCLQESLKPAPARTRIAAKYCYYMHRAVVEN